MGSHGRTTQGENQGRKADIVILRVPDYYEEFSCIASRCKDSCCAGWEIDIDEDSYAYYKSCEGEFGDRLRESMYVAEDGGYRFKLKAPKRCAMLNDNNLCDLYTALGEEALCEVCTEYPRFSLFYGNVEQKCLSLSCEEVGRILFERQEPVSFVDHEMPDYYECDGIAVDGNEETEACGQDAENCCEEMENCGWDAENSNEKTEYCDGDMADCGEDEDPEFIAFMEQVQNRAVAILQDRNKSIEERMCSFLSFCRSAQDVINHYQAKGDPKALTVPEGQPDGIKGERSLSYEDFCDRFAIFKEMEELDEEWVNTKKEFAQLFREDTYGALLTAFLESGDYREVDYEQLLVYFTFRYLMNAVYDYDLISCARLVVVATLVVRDMDAVRFQRNGGHFTTFDRIDTARIFSKEVEHSQGNADDLKEMCMMEEIASLEALCRQI